MSPSPFCGSLRDRHRSAAAGSSCGLTLPASLHLSKQHTTERIQVAQSRPCGCIPDFWTADVCIRYGQLFVFRDPTRTWNLDWRMDRTVAAQFSCNPPLWAPCPTISSPPAAVRDSSKHRCSATGPLPDRRTAAKKAHRSVRRGFGGGRCGGNPPAQGRAEGPTAQKQERGKRNALAHFSQSRDKVVAETLRFL